MRPGWDEYFMQIAHTVGTRATCPRASVGCVISREYRILTTGYNGAPRGVAHCTEVGCTLVNDHCLRATHAEANAVVQGALHGVSLQHATAYCTASALRQLLEAADQRRRDQDYLSRGLSRRRRGPAPGGSRRRAGAIRDTRRSARVSAHHISPGLLYGAAFVIAALMSVLATPLVVRLALRLEIVDNAAQERRMHAVPKPRVGGIAVFFGFAFALFTVLGLSQVSPFGIASVSRSIRCDSQTRRTTFRQPPDTRGRHLGRRHADASAQQARRTDRRCADFDAVRLRDSGNYRALRSQSGDELDRLSDLGRRAPHAALVRRDDECDQLSRRVGRTADRRRGNLEPLSLRDLPCFTPIPSSRWSSRH